MRVLNTAHHLTKKHQIPTSFPTSWPLAEPFGVSGMELCEKPSVGCFLVAHPLLAGPEFSRSVVLLTDYGEQGGATGLVLNVPSLGLVNSSTVVAQNGEEGEGERESDLEGWEEEAAAGRAKRSSVKVLLENVMTHNLNRHSLYWIQAVMLTSFFPFFLLFHTCPTLYMYMHLYFYSHSHLYTHTLYPHRIFQC